MNTARKLSLLAIIIISGALTIAAQDRTDTSMPFLTYASKNLDNARYWEQDGSSWKSRKCDKLVYQGEGVACENFSTMFIGKTDGRTFLFVDRHDYYWQYPELRLEWKHKRMMYQVLLSENDYNRLDSLATGETYTITPQFVNAMCQDNRDYSFPFFLMLSSSLLPTAGATQPEPFITVRRFTGSDGKDVVRFRFGIFVELIDSFYFEVPYQDWRKLFTPEGKKGRK